LSKPEQSDSALFGTCVDKLVFGVGPIISIRKPREPKPDNDRFNISVTDAMHRSAQDCAWSVLGFAKSHGIDLAGAQGQKQPRWRWQADGGVWCSGRPDWYTPGPEQDLIIDLKTSFQLGDKVIERTVQAYGYDIQAASYLEAADAIYGKNPKRNLRFLFVESKEPYLCRWVTLDSRCLGNGMAKWRKACAVWKDCLDSDAWPGYDDISISCPPWSMTKQEIDFDLEDK